MNTSSFIDEIKRRLFEPEARRLQAGINRLVEQNEEITKDTKKGFMFSGQVYRHSAPNVIYKSYSSLAWELTDEMNKWLKDSKQVDLDRDQIGQLLFKMQSKVMDSGTDQQTQEHRDALPECLIHLVPEYRGRPRILNVDFFLEPGRDRRQFAKLLPKIEMYAMASLIY